MTGFASAYFSVAVIVIAVCAVCITVILYWVASSLIAGTNSLKKLIETVDYNVHETVDALQQSITDVNKITEQAGEEMQRLDQILKDFQNIARDGSSSMRLIDETLAPSLINLKSISAGLRKAVETWNDSGPADGGERKKEEKPEENGSA